MPTFVLDGRLYIPTQLIFVVVPSISKNYTFNFKLLNDLTCTIAIDMQDFL